MSESFKNRIERHVTELRALGISDKVFAYEAGLHPSRLNKIKRGHTENPRQKTRDNIERAFAKLKRDGVERVLGPPPLTTAIAEKAFLTRLSEVTQEDLADTPYSYWRTKIASEHYAKIVPACDETMRELDCFTAGRDFAALFGFIADMIALLHSAHAKIGSVETRTVLFKAHAKPAHWHCYIAAPKQVRRYTGRHEARMEDLVHESGGDVALTEQLLAWKGDSLKIAGGSDAKLNEEARQYLQDSVDIRHGVIRQYQGARSLAIAAAMSRQTDAEVDKALAVAVRAAERANGVIAKRIRSHMFDGISEANAERFAQTRNPKYRKASIESYERGDKLWGEAEGVEPPNEELAVRRDGLKIKLARCRIPDFLKASGMTMGEALRKQLKAAYATGSTRIVESSLAALEAA